MSSAPGIEGVPAHELALWTRRFAAMIDAGVSLMHCMDLLAEEDTTPSMRAVTRDLMARVEAGETLSQAMLAWPQVFGEHYVGLVVFGEVGGILQIGLNRLSERMESGLLITGWEERRPLTRADLAEWSWQFAHLLKAGVPPLYALGTLAKTTHPALRRISEQAVAELQAGGSLAPERDGAPADELPVIWRHPEVFSPTVRELIGFAVWFGPLDQGLLRVADLLEREAQWEAKGLLPPLPEAALEAKPPSAGEARRSHSVIRQANDVFKAAINAGARWIELTPAEKGEGQATLRKDPDVLTTIPLPRYEQVVRRIKIMADIDPFVQEERRSQIHLGYQGKEYLILVRSQPAPHGGRLELRFGEDERAVSL